MYTVYHSVFAGENKPIPRKDVLAAIDELAKKPDTAGNGNRIARAVDLPPELVIKTSAVQSEAPEAKGIFSSIRAFVILQLDKLLQQNPSFQPFLTPVAKQNG